MSDANQAPAADASLEAAQESQENQEISGEQEAAASSEGEDLRSEAEINADKSLTKAEKQEEKRFNKLRLKFNGKEYDEELPFEIPDTPEARKFMTEHLQKSKLSQSKAQEFSTLEKQAVEFIEQLRKNPRAILTDPSIGLDLKKFAAEIIEEEIENSKKSPEQLEAEKLKKELKSLKDERDKEKEVSKQREMERLTEEAFKNYENQIESALQGSDIPKTPYTVKKMSDWMLLGLEQKIEISPKEALELVREEMHNDLKQMFAVMPEDVIESIVGRENINKIRKKSLAKAKSAPKAPAPLKASLSDTGQKSEEKPKEAKKVSMRDFFGV